MVVMQLLVLPVPSFYFTHKRMPYLPLNFTFPYVKELFHFPTFVAKLGPVISVIVFWCGLENHTGKPYVCAISSGFPFPGGEYRSRTDDLLRARQAL